MGKTTFPSTDDRRISEPTVPTVRLCGISLAQVEGDGKSVPCRATLQDIFCFRDFPNSKPQRVSTYAPEVTLKKMYCSVFPSKTVIWCYLFFLKNIAYIFSFWRYNTLETRIFLHLPRFGKFHSILGWLHTASPVMRHSSVGGPSFTRLKT